MKKAPKIVNDRPRGGGRVGLPTQAYSQDNRDAYRREKDANVGAGEATGYSSNLEFISKISSLISKRYDHFLSAVYPTIGQLLLPWSWTRQAIDSTCPLYCHTGSQPQIKAIPLKTPTFLLQSLCLIKTCSTGSLVFHLLLCLSAGKLHRQIESLNCRMSGLQYVKRMTPSIIRILASNPSPMTGQGTNCYLIGSGQRRVLLDTGSPNDESIVSSLVDVLDSENCEIDKIVISHWHFDHIGGVEAIQRQIGSNIPLYKHKRVRYPKVYKGAGEKMPSGVDIPVFKEQSWNFLSDGDVLETSCGNKIQVLFTPGHADDHICLWIENERVLFR